MNLLKLSCIGVLLSFHAIAGTVVLTAGSEITLKAGEETTVQCKGGTGSGTFYCYCNDYGSYLYLTRQNVFEGKQVSSQFLEKIAAKADCDKAIVTHPACLK